MFENKDFTSDFFSKRIDKWTEVLTPLKDKKVDILEIGSYEGKSAVFFAKFLPHSRITCVDLFNGEFEERFDKNTAEFGDQITKIKGSAIAALDGFLNPRRMFNVIYLDGGKLRDHVLGMSLLAWRLLRGHGILIWDDYAWGRDKPSESRPHDGIDTFLNLHKGEFNYLERGAQCIIRKRRPPGKTVAPVDS